MSQPSSQHPQSGPNHHGQFSNGRVTGTEIGNRILVLLLALIVIAGPLTISWHLWPVSVAAGLMLLAAIFSADRLFH